MIAGVRAELGKDDNTAIIGLGGVMRWQDAAELILAGASAIGMATALYVDPRLAVRVGRGLSKWVRRQGVASLSELTGAMSKDPIQPC